MTSVRPLFHVAPVSARSAIAREGLDGRARRHLYLDRPAGCCVYLFGSLEAAGHWAVKELLYGEHALREGWDVWQVDREGLTVHRDESPDFSEEDEACYATRPVEAERLQLLGGADLEMVESALGKVLEERFSGRS